MKKRSEKRQRHEKSVRRRAAKQRTQKLASVRAQQPGMRLSPDGGDDIDPLPFVDAYANSLSVFGEQMPPAFLVDRIKSCDWRESFVRLSHLAAILANDPLGPKSPRALQLGKRGLASLTAHTADAQEMLARGRRFVAGARRPIVVAHEESLVLLQHLVLLYGGNGGARPDDGELALWLLGASDHVEAWLEPDGRALEPIEQLAAEMVKAYRFNRSSVDEVRLQLRARRLFEQPPRQGLLSSPASWAELQRYAFGSTFEHYFETFACMLCSLSHTWAKDDSSIPIITPATVAELFGKDEAFFVEKLAEVTATRAELVTEIKRRMAPGMLLPHAPTALLRKPFVSLENGQIVASSPWNVRALLRTGIWARYLAAAKAMLGPKGGDEWSIAFGQMLEEWCRDYARRSTDVAKIAVRLELPSSPGAADEIEDVVLVDESSVLMCSVKARLVREDIARHAISRSKLLDWYEEYFFKQKSEKFRVGVIAQLSARIDLLRAGAFEDRVARDVYVLPVLVTFDHLCANPALYEWLVERCKTHGLLQQPDVGPLTISVIDDFERLIGAPAHGLSPARILASRSSAPNRNERLDVVLFNHRVKSRLPGTNDEYRALTDRMLDKLRQKP